MSAIKKPRALCEHLSGFGKDYTEIFVLRIGNCWEAMIKVTISACPHCRSFDALCVTEVERQGYAPETWPMAVHCGECGACGPWGRNEEAAVRAWNKTTGVNTVLMQHGFAMQFPLELLLNDDGCPF